MITWTLALKKSSRSVVHLVLYYKSPVADAVFSLFWGPLSRKLEHGNKCVYVNVS